MKEDFMVEISLHICYMPQAKEHHCTLHMLASDTASTFSGKYLYLPRLILATLKLIFWFGTGICIFLAVLIDALSWFTVIACKYMRKKSSTVDPDTTTTIVFWDAKIRKEITEDFIAGNFEVVAGREDVVDVTKNQLIADYNKCICDGSEVSGYCFLRILSGKEKRNFIDSMNPDMLVCCYKTRSIKTLDWIRILQNISLETKYHVYRRSYWGENGGSTKISTSKTSTMTLVCVISGTAARDNIQQGEDEEDADVFSWLIKRITNIGLRTKPRVNLLLENNHVTIIDKIIPSSWSNDAYMLDETEDEIKM